MSTKPDQMNDTQLDAALDRLHAPVPSDLLVARVRAMAPRPERVFMTPRRAAAAMLVAALGAATILQMAVIPHHHAASVAAIADPAGEISLPDLVQEEDESSTALPTEPFSVAGVPLE